jgi:regulator of sigma E protease
LDPNANAGKPDPVNPPPGPPPDNTLRATGGAGDQPDHAAEVSALKTWLRENLVSLIITGIIIALIIIYTDPIDTLKVIIGLGLVIFIHELGHFLAAKWCDVHVKTFSIGFGPAVPFCSYKWGETTYMVGIIPLGGYVAMVGEGEGAGDDDAEEDPRSFRKKTVGQRMLIISAGVIMNVLLGMACFVAAYLHGVKEEPGIVGTIHSGGAAWQAGLRSDDRIVRINTRDNPTFKDLRPYVMSTRKGETVKVWIERDGKVLEQEFNVEPLREEGMYFPALGISAQAQLKLLSVKKRNVRPVVPGSPASESNPAFAPGDRIVGMTDPANPSGPPTALPPDPRDPASGLDVNEYYRRLSLLADKPITFRVEREKDKSIAEITVHPMPRTDLGMRMRMGRVAALRAGGPAAKAGVLASTENEPHKGDRIKSVRLPEPDGKETWLTTGAVGPGQRKLDPVLLPMELKKWFDRLPPNSTDAQRTVKLELLRKEGHEENKLVEIAMVYNPEFRFDRELIPLPNSPAPLSGLGLAYWVEAVVDEVAGGGPADGKLQPNDQITAVRFHTRDNDGNLTADDWKELKDNQWASVDAGFQSRPKGKIDLKVKRVSGEELEVLDLEGRPDMQYPLEERGLVLQQDYRVQTASDIGEALKLGAWRTGRFIKEIYMNLSAMLFGRVSPKTLSGPLTIANVSYKFAGEDFWQFLLFLGMISVNLAVVNFLPIPVLDGGHMVFLILEKILGRPVPERIFAFAMYTGLFLILGLMVYVISLDIDRLF